MLSAQQLFDEDMDLCVKISEHLIPILDNQTNHSNTFFLSNQLFTFLES